MTQPYKLYLDVCCLNRPFDDWAQPRIRLEAEAVVAILDRVQVGDWLLISSTALVSEIAQTPDTPVDSKLWTCSLPLRSN